MTTPPPAASAPEWKQPLHEREAFEEWYALNAFDLKAAPIGSRDCDLQWRAWRERAALRTLASHKAQEAAPKKNTPGAILKEIGDSIEQSSSLRTLTDELDRDADAMEVASAEYEEAGLMAAQFRRISARIKAAPVAAQDGAQGVTDVDALVAIAYTICDDFVDEFGDGDAGKLDDGQWEDMLRQVIERVAPLLAAPRPSAGEAAYARAKAQGLTDQCAEFARQEATPPVPQQAAPEVVALAKKLYGDFTNNHPTIHCNRFPAWEELPDTGRKEWIDKAALRRTSAGAGGE